MSIFKFPAMIGIASADLANDRRNAKTKNTVIYLLVLAGLLFCTNIQAQDDIRIGSIPYSLKIYNHPAKTELEGDSVVTITAEGKTNLFNSPGKTYYVQNAPMLLFHPDSSFTLTAKITASHKEVYDVAALVIYENKDLWAKLCFENSVNKEPTVVSVVTRKYSDDCNSEKVENDFAYLAIVKKGKEFSFHYSKDNIKWELVRHFYLECDDNDLMIGFAVHCSVAQIFSASFSEITYSANALDKMRKFE